MEFGLLESPADDFGRFVVSKILKTLFSCKIDSLKLFFIISKIKKSYLFMYTFVKLKNKIVLLTVTFK